MDRIKDWEDKEILTHTDLNAEFDNIINNANWSGSGGGLAWSVVDSNTSAVTEHGYLINASSNNVTLTLPATPSIGDVVGICDFYNKGTTNTITIARNTKNIEGITEDLIININGAGFTLVYSDSTRGWEIVTEINAGSGINSVVEDTTPQLGGDLDVNGHGLGAQAVALNMNTHKVTGVVDPTADQEVATKKYVDDNAGGVSDIAYAASWNGVTGIAPSKNAVYDKIETLGADLPAVDTTGMVKGSADSTKIMRFEVDGLTTATTRVLTVQDKDYTLADHADLHTQGTDTALGAQAENLNMNTHKITGLTVPSGAGDSVRATATITEAAVEDAISKKHTVNTDTTLGTQTADINMGTHKLTALSVPSAAGHSVRATASITEAALESAITNDHAANADTDLDATFEATFVKKADTVNVLSDITSTGANIEDAVTKKHAATLIGTKTIDETDIANTKVIAYNSTSGNLEYESAGTPDAHATSHENAGGDEVSVVGLSGLLADDQHVLDSEVLAVAAVKGINTDITSMTGLDDKGIPEAKVVRTKSAVIKVIADDTTLTTGNGKAYFTIPIELNGTNLVSVGAHVYTTSSSGLPSFQIHNLTDTSDMLSTNITIDATEKDSKDATTPAVINTATDDVVTGDELRFDCDEAGTGTKGMEIRMGFRLP